MEQFIGCDAHKKFSVFVAVNEKGQAGEAVRVLHDRELYRKFLAELPVINQRLLAGSHVVRLYQRIKRRKNHQKAVVAVARHLAEAAWWVLTRFEIYREPQSSRKALSSTHG